MQVHFIYAAISSYYVLSTKLSPTETTVSKTDTHRTVRAVMELLVSWGKQTDVITHVCDYVISAVNKYIMQLEDQRRLFLQAHLKDMVNLIPNVNRRSTPAHNHENFLRTRPGNREQVVKKHDQ